MPGMPWSLACRSNQAGSAATNCRACCRWPGLNGPAAFDERTIPQGRWKGTAAVRVTVIARHDCRVSGGLSDLAIAREARAREDWPEAQAAYEAAVGAGPTGEAYEGLATALFWPSCSSADSAQFNQEERE